MKKNKIKLAKSEVVLYTVNNVVLFLFAFVVAFPLLNMIASSFSSGEAVAAGRVSIWPVDFTFEGYEAVFKNEDIVTGYLNTIFYTVAGTAFNIFITLLAAYPLSRKNLPGKGWIMFLFTFTMMFHGGMVPTYIQIRDLGLIDTRWAMILPAGLSVYNMIITRTNFMSNIPDELLEAAKIDGASDIKFFLTMVIPLSKAIIAVITLYYAVAHWNAFFNAFIYLNDRKLFPLQLIMREILIENSMSQDMTLDTELMIHKQNVADMIKYSLIMVASVPLWCIYPFIQKYFVQGVMIGSIKG
ncbi:MAG: carbohydrate ABC transporter permease [Ruminococcaceae bacterium]|nr:carbohydrate ABC transporter permease [Oscillospiraceae bacterium]